MAQVAEDHWLSDELSYPPTTYHLLPADLREESSKIRIPGVRQFITAAVKTDAPLVEHQEASGRGRALPVAAGHRDQRLSLGREQVVDEHRGVLQSLCNHHRRDVLRVTQFGYKDVDRVSRHRVQPSCRRVIQHDGRLADDGAGDRDAPPHPTRQQIGRASCRERVCLYV